MCTWPEYFKNLHFSRKNLNIPVCRIHVDSNFLETFKICSSFSDMPIWKVWISFFDFMTSYQEKLDEILCDFYGFFAIFFVNNGLFGILQTIIYEKKCKKPIKITQNFIEFFLISCHEIKETHPNFPNLHVTK